MYFSFIDTLSNLYGYLSKARGRCSEEAIKNMAAGALALADNAEPLANTTGLKLSPSDIRDLDEIKLMRNHIEEMMVFQLSQEIV